MKAIERDPGLIINVAQKDVVILDGKEYMDPGTKVKIVRGPFKGFEGHVHSTGYFDDVKIRTGDPKEWEKYDAETLEMGRKLGLL